MKVQYIDMLCAHYVSEFISDSTILYNQFTINTNRMHLVAANALPKLHTRITLGTRLGFSLNNSF